LPDKNQRISVKNEPGPDLSCNIQLILNKLFTADFLKLNFFPPAITKINISFA
jgi:hypothetical protein